MTPKMYVYDTVTYPSHQTEIDNQVLANQSSANFNTSILSVSYEYDIQLSTNTN
jgi:hypothetical protein